MSRFFENKYVQRILHINDTPEAIALGAAVGMFIGMTPTVGIQMVLMVIVGTVIRANRLAGVAMVYVSNPFTVLPIYWLAWLNRRTFAYDALAAHATRQEWRRLFEQHRGRMLLLGVLLGLLGHVPFVGLLVPAFAALAYVHYGLAALRRERDGAVVVIEGEVL